MADDIKSRAKVLVMRGEKVIAEIGPGSGFPKNEDGSPATQHAAEDFVEGIRDLVESGAVIFSD